MKKMIGNYILLFFLNLFIISCGQNLENTSNANSYVEFLQKKDVEEIKNQIRNDTVFLNKIVDFSTIRYRISLSVSSSVKMKLTESVPEFKQIDSILLKEKFNEYVLSSYFEQQFYIALPDKKEFRLFSNKQFLFRDDLFHKFNDSYKNSKYIFDYIENNVEISNEKYYFIGNKINKEEIGLKGIDSVNVNLSIKYPAKIEKIVIKPYEQKKINFKNHIIKIEKSELGLEIPIAISKDLVNIQGINKSNIRMSASTSSSYPIIEIHHKIKNEIEDLSRILNNVLVAKDKKQIINLLNQINQNHFNTKNMLADFKQKADKLNKEIKEKEDFSEIEYYESLVNSGRKIITLENQFINFDFPDEVKSIEIYLAKENNIISKNETLYSKDKKFNKYNIYGQEEKDNYRSLYGILNKNGEILVKAKYRNIEHVDNEYFNVDEGEGFDEFSEYRLDEKEKKFVKLSNLGYSYYGSVKPGFDILKDIKKEKFGIMKNFKEIIFPFDYEEIDFDPNIPFVEFYLNNTPEFFDKNLNKINLNGRKIKTIYNFYLYNSELDFPELYVAIDSTKKRILINNKLEYISLEYDDIKNFYNINDYFIVIKGTSNVDYKYGLINTEGKEVTPITFDFINNNSEEGIIEFNEKRGDKTKKLKIEDFLKKYYL
ncbi:WG repeat-containing protein [Chishuiella sp.]|uniref:WG repeat-containing protein n=1 Tax=Chishuiella sp. TaxID=1969467 RepID=UPI0028ACC36F|nr:WG repeat-containing protein [Chishuiella sp.]